MKLVSSGWVYEIPPTAAFIEVTSIDGERNYVECFDRAGEKLPPLSGDLLSNVAPVPSWPKRLATVAHDPRK